MGIGLMIGPIVGSSIYTAVGFKWTFVFLGATLLPLAFLFCCLLLRTVREFKGAREQLKKNEEFLPVSENDEVSD